MRPFSTLLAVLALLAAGVPAAQAATIDRTGSLITYAGQGTEANDVEVREDATEIVVTDASAVVITATGDCTAEANVARCPREGTERIDLELGDNDDEVTLPGVDGLIVFEFGGPGEDVLRGTDGVSSNVTLVGGPDRDTYAAVPQRASYVSYRDKTGDLDISIDGQPNDPDDEDVGPEFFGVEGGEGDDVITGSSDGDYLGGLGGDDEIDGLASRDTMFGGTGADDLDGGDGEDFGFGDAGSDVILGGSGNDQNLNGGPGDDRLDAGAGNDNLSTDPGADDLRGGEGFDRLFSFSTADEGTAPRDVTITLDDRADDGQAGEGDNVHADLEDLSAPVRTAGATAGRVDVTGSAGTNVLGTNNAADAIDPGAGADQVTSFGGDDTVFARDGFTDRIDCGAGDDAVVVDQLDELTDCEEVDRATVPAVTAPEQQQPPPAPAQDDGAPTASFASPASGALLPASTPTTVAVDARDDRGIARVDLLDDGRIVGSDTSAPYEFPYVARGDDVGRNTLVAVAVDGAGQTGSAVRAVRVDRFTPTVTASSTPRRDRRGPFRFRTTGRLTPPAGVACGTGRIAVQIKRGRRTISTRRPRLTRACTFATRVTFAVPRRLGNGRLRVIARWQGNAVLAPASAPTVRVRAG